MPIVDSRLAQIRGYMFLPTTKIQLKLFKEEIINLSGKCSSIMEFVSTPLLCKDFTVPKHERAEYENITSKLKSVSAKLDEIKDILNNF